MLYQGRYSRNLPDVGTDVILFDLQELCCDNGDDETEMADSGCLCCILLIFDSLSHELRKRAMTSADSLQSYASYKTVYLTRCACSASFTYSFQAIAILRTLLHFLFCCTLTALSPLPLPLYPFVNQGETFGYLCSSVNLLMLRILELLLILLSELVFAKLEFDKLMFSVFLLI